MILILLAVVCLATVPLTGGKLGRLASLPIRWMWAGPLAILLQTVVVTIVPDGSHWVHALVYAGTYLIIGAFLWANRRIAGVPVIAAGTLLNSIAIMSNGGVMPASVTAERLSGLRLGGGYHNSIVVAHPHLLFLGDIIPVPWPLPNVLSIGDCVVFAGLLVLLHRTCRAGAGAEAGATPAASGDRVDPQLAHAGGSLDLDPIVHLATDQGLGDGRAARQHPAGRVGLVRGDDLEAAPVLSTEVRDLDDAAVLDMVGGPRLDDHRRPQLRPKAQDLRLQVGLCLLGGVVLAVLLQVAPFASRFDSRRDLRAATAL